MRETTWWFPLAPTPYTTQQSVCSLPVPVPWTYPDVAAVQYQALKSSSPQVCPDYASYSSDRSKFSISSTSLLIREPVKQVTSAVLLLFAVLQSVLSPQGKQCLWWSFQASTYYLSRVSISVQVPSKLQNASEPSHMPSNVKSCMKEALGAFCPMPVLYARPGQAIPRPLAHHSGNSSLLQCCRTSDLQHHYPELCGGIALLWK